MIETRLAALDAACRISREGEPTSGVLSRASQIETYLATGLIRTGPNWTSAAEVGVEGVSVMVEAPGLEPHTVGRIADAVKAILR